MAQDSLTYYPSLARFGFAGPIRLPKATDEEAGPAIVFADATRSIFLADMSGDGLSDNVRIRTGEVCYWPNLGYGRFGAKVTMDVAPWFDAPDLFDPARIRLADVDGSGVTDIVYLGIDGVRLYFNQSGNAWSMPQTVMDFPLVEELATIEVIDLLGNGTACLVWSSADPSDAGRSMRYIDLLGRDKPYLMVRSANNLGAETRVSYAPSTAFYLADRAAGRPWATRLPFPVHVVERVETYDWVSRNRFVTRYAYHHGYYDGTEREFRGFGMVEQRDTEELGVLGTSDAFPAGANIDAASYVPPVLTKTWYHTGAYPIGAGVTRIYETEYWPQPPLTADQVGAVALPDSPLAPDLSGDEIREALRSLKGAMLRQEVYALDGTAQAKLPYSVSERNYTIKRLQPFGGNRHAVFLTHACESLDLHYERTLYAIGGEQLGDPRTTHAIVLEADDFGNELKSVMIAYGRRHGDLDPLMQASDRTAQGATLVTYTESAYTNAILADDAYRAELPADMRTYELTGYTPSGAGGRFQSADFVRQTATGLQPIYDSEILYEAAPGAGRQRRLIEQVRALYRGDNLQNALPLFRLESLALPFARYKLAFTPGLLANVYQRPQDGQPPENLLPTPASVLADEGGYVSTDAQQAAGLFPSSDPTGRWWIPSGQVFYSPGATNPPAADPPAPELANAQAHFFLARRYQDIFGNVTTVAYDSYDLLPTQVLDPVGNTVTAAVDYRVLQPATLTDANGNQSTVAFDALGMVAGSAVTDKAVAGQQDSLTDFAADLTQAQIDAFFADPRGPSAATLLGTATSRIVYDLGRFACGTPAAPTPTFVASITRETHVQALATGAASRLQVGIGFSDGFGREIQRKAQADAGPLVASGPMAARRWIASGWTIWNNKGKPVRKYEPFFTADADFSYGTTVGVSATLFYDPLGRVVATLHPDQSWEKVTFDPWRQESWDRNDTVQSDPSTDADVGALFKRLPSSDYLPTWYAQHNASTAAATAQDAAKKAAVHAGTPTTVHVDALGRAFLTLAWNRTALGGAPADSHDRTGVALDIEGNQRSVTDALGRAVTTYDYDMLGTRLHQSSVDAGDRWMLNDATGKPLLGWDSRGFRLEHRYDPARRPTDLLFQSGSAKAVLAERVVYGESAPNAAANNLRGKAHQQFDAAGVVTNAAYDFTGNLIQSARELLSDPTRQVDWSLTPAPALTGEVFAARTTFDALNRPLTSTAPDGSVVTPAYDDAGILVQVAVNLQGAATATPFVSNIAYDAKGQRTLIAYGNGAQTAYTYDPATFRLATLTTTLPSTPGAAGATLQALSYSYDPVGNITHIADAAQQTVFFANQIVEPSNDYVHDARYRLIQAQGRESIGLASAPQTTWDDSARLGQALPLPSDGQALRTYAETYAYDAVGNFLSLAHAAANGNWTRTYAYDEPTAPAANNRLTSTTIGSTKETYSYDAHGNMTTMPHLPLMAWDFKDQLQATQIRVANDAAVETTHYVYDSGGQRVRKFTTTATGAIAHERIYLGSFELYREYGAGASAPTLERQTLHVLDGTRRIAMVEALTKGSDDSPAQLLRYQLANHLGSSSLELDGSGAMISYEEYYPYGSTSYQAVDARIKPAAKRYRFTQKERDEETGCNYHGARYYAPWLGRWMSCDPSETGGTDQPYVYVRSNPIIFWDPDGRDATVTIDHPENKPPHVVIHLHLILYPTDEARKQNVNKEIIQTATAPRIKRGIEAEWHKDNVSFDGMKFSFDVEVTTTVYEDRSSALKAANDRADPDDVVGITLPPLDSPDMYHRSHGPPAAGHWGTHTYGSQWDLYPDDNGRDPGKVYAHEAGHLMGLSDDYFDLGRPETPRSIDETKDSQHQGHLMHDTYNQNSQAASHEITDIIINNTIDLASSFWNRISCECAGDTSHQARLGCSDQGLQSEYRKPQNSAERARRSNRA